MARKRGTGILFPPDKWKRQRNGKPAKEKVLKARDIAGQAAGHFIGKIAGGKPPFFNVQMDMCRFEEKEIPRFSLPVRLGNGKEEMELEILEEIIQQNYIKIIEDVNAILKR